MSILLGYGEYYRPDSSNNDPEDAVRWHARLQFVEAIDKITSIRKFTLKYVYRLFSALANDVARLASGEKTNFIPDDYSVEEAYFAINSWKAIVKYLGEPLPSIRMLTKEELENGLRPNTDIYDYYAHVKMKNQWDEFLFMLAREIMLLEATFQLGDQGWFCEMVITLFWRKKRYAIDSWAMPTKYMKSTFDFIPADNITDQKSEKVKDASNRLRCAESINFKAVDWNPIMETRENAKKRIKKSFDEFLKKEFDEKESLLQTIGYIRTPEKRNPEHYEWLAQYIIEGKDYIAIAQKCSDADPEGNRDIGTNTIRKAIVTTADLIGVTL